MKTLLPLHNSPLSSPIVAPTLLTLWMIATVPPEETSSPPSLPPSGQVGSRYEERSLCAKAKGSLGTASVRQSPLLKPLSGKHVSPQVLASKPKGSGLRRSASLVELDL